MTAQIPERILVDGKPHWLYAEPLYPFLEAHQAKIEDPDAWTTACHREYVGTWDIVDGGLWLVALSTYGREEQALSDDMRSWFLKLAQVDSFPLYADWFSGCLRIPIGPRLIRGFHGWSSWFARERVITCRKGRVVRDREVDTLAILEWVLRRDKRLREEFDPGDTPDGPLAWASDQDGDFDHLRGDWWPPGWSHGDASTALGSWFVSGTWFDR